MITVYAPAVRQKFERMTDLAILEVIQGRLEGKVIQFKTHDNEWKDCLRPVWSFTEIVYRVKPQPRTYYMEVDLIGNVRRTSKEPFKPLRGYALVETLEVVQVVESALDNSIG